MNEHPLTDNLMDLSYEDLDKRINELTKRWHTARRMNMNPDVMHQLNIMLDGLEAEKQRRAFAQENKSGVVIDTDWNTDAKAD
jgi:hypothetical protein